MKKLQIALDLLTLENALDVLSKVAEHIDVIEVGTPLMISEGCKAVQTIKRKYPQKTVFADIKVMDGGSVVPKIAFSAGADMVSVLAAADNKTILATLDCAKVFGGKVLVDMCSIADLTKRGLEIDQMNADYVCVHVGYDIQNLNIDPIEELKKISSLKTKKAIAGGIRLESFQNAVKSAADIIIVGGGLYNQPDMVSTAREMHRTLQSFNREQG